jgi:hypothetical protein
MVQTILDFKVAWKKNLVLNLYENSFTYATYIPGFLFTEGGGFAYNKAVI